jgi:glycosyltransferase involved in cell wall biosynthesis
VRIVLLNQFYPPDPAPTGRYLHELARALVARGHEVRVLASRHGYAGGERFAANEVLDGVHVKRLGGFAFGRATHAGKLADYAGYATALAPRLAIQQADVIVALTSPPFLGLVAALAARLRRARVVHWAMDVYPDVMRAHGMIDGAPFAALEQLARGMYRGADVAIALAPTMAEHLRRHVPEGVAIEVVPLWMPPGLSPWADGESIALRAARGWDACRAVLMYSGNLGLGHRFEEMLSAAQRLGADGPRWVFAGAGRGREPIERFVAANPDAPVELLDAVPEARLREHLCSADVHLASVDPGWEGLIVPSKLQAAFAVGKPVIHVGDPGGDLGRWVEASRGGWVVEPGDVDGLVRAAIHANDVNEAKRRGAAGHAWAQTQFAAAGALARLADLVEGERCGLPSRHDVVSVL